MMVKSGRSRSVAYWKKHIIPIIVVLKHPPKRNNQKWHTYLFWRQNEGEHLFTGNIACESYCFWGSFYIGKGNWTDFWVHLRSWKISMDEKVLRNWWYPKIKIEMMSSKSCYVFTVDFSLVNLLPKWTCSQHLTNKMEQNVEHFGC